MRRVRTSYSRLVWETDGSYVTKSRPPSAVNRRRFRNELRVNRLLLAHEPPVPTPALVGHDAQTRSLTFEALPGDPIGPKYPHEITDGEVDAILSLSRALEPYNPRRRWLRHLDSVRRLRLANNLGLLDAARTTALVDIAQRHNTLRFGHGDLTARNVLRHHDEVALIDWEWAGLYPDGFDAAFLWFTLGEVEGGRTRVEQSVGNPESFLLCALLIQLWHLQLYVPTEFRARHLATRDELLDRLI